MAAALDVIAKARAGDLQGAISAGEIALAAQPTDADLRLFVGVLCCRRGDLDRGIAHMRKVVSEQPGNSIARIELVRALLDADEGEAVLELTVGADVTTAQGRDLLRVRGHAFGRLRRTEEALDAFSMLVAADSADFESRNGLGLALFAQGQYRAASLEFWEAVHLQPAGAAFWINLSHSAAAVFEWKTASDAADRAIGLAPKDIQAMLALSRARAGLEDKAGARSLLEDVIAQGKLSSEIWAEIAEVRSQLRDFVVAEMAFNSAIAADRGSVRAWVGLGSLLERLNRQEDLEAHLAAAAAAGISKAALALLHARLARKSGHHEEALAYALQAPPGGDPATRAQLIGTIADRLGRYEEAFSAFAEANTAIAASAAAMAAAAEANLSHYAAMRALMTQEWLRNWLPSEDLRFDGRRDPLFIFGFPRSGTTLIDTMLSGHPDTVVLEEEGIIQRTASSVGRPDRIPNLILQELSALRSRYFSEVDARVTGVGGKLVVDKEPLGLSSTLLLHRLFPNARFVFAERHPCDVVLSCWMTSLRFDHRVGSFHDLVSIARLYDAVLGFWTQCVEMLPIATTTVRYERLIVTPEAELRKLADFAGLSWQPALLANEKNAAKRKYIGSPSYAQVGEPLYNHAAGRWTRYRPWIDPILPILEPWIERLGY